MDGGGGEREQTNAHTHIHKHRKSNRIKGEKEGGMKGGEKEIVRYHYFTCH